jgi:hypothetical protein
MKRGVDPTRFPDMIWPMIVCILTDDDADEKGDVAARAKRVLADFKAGRYNTG